MEGGEVADAAIRAVEDDVEVGRGSRGQRVRANPIHSVRCSLDAVLLQLLLLLRQTFLQYQI